MNQLQATEAALARVLDAVPGLSLTAQTASGDDGVDGVLEFAGARERLVEATFGYLGFTGQPRR